MMRGLSIQGQLAERFREGYELLSCMFYRRRRCGGTYQALTQATQRVGMAVFADFWCCLRQTIPKRVGTGSTWYGWTVFAVDGSRSSPDHIGSSPPSAETRYARSPSVNLQVVH